MSSDDMEWMHEPDTHAFIEAWSAWLEATYDPDNPYGEEQEE
jgi:hypothetical protein